MAPLVIPPTLLRAVMTHAVEGLPHEVCGVLLAPLDDNEHVTEMHRIQNVAHSATAFRFDEGEHLRVLMSARARGLCQRVIYHSHVEADAAFSVEDRAQALWDGHPTWPGVAYLVVAVRGGVPEAAQYAYDRGDWVGTTVALPAG